MGKVAIVTGANGQDGSYLCELLLEKGYRVFACIRRSSQDTLGLIRHILPRLEIRCIDMNDAISLSNVVREVDGLMELYESCEIYNLAAQSHVHISFFVPEYTAECDALGLLRILECVRQSTHRGKMRVYQASTSELYGDTTGSVIQSETTQFLPKSPYATAKLYAYWISRNYRDSYGMFVSNGILFNHESPRRGVEFITRKLTSGMVDIFKQNRKTPVKVGNLDSKRDWGYAKDYVEAMWRMLQHSTPDDWVIATGEVHSVRDVVNCIAKNLDVTLEWKQTTTGLEYAEDSNKTVWIEQSEEFMRPNDVTYLCGDSTKARRELRWEPTLTFDELIRQMTIADLEKGLTGNHV
jgi:GDPmannose 4,6-dehydratase